AGIPSRIWLQRVVDAHSENIWLMAFLEMQREIVDETYIAVGTHSQRMAVDPHFAALINTIEQNKYLLSGCDGRQRKLLAIPSDAHRQIRTCLAPRDIFAKGTFDAPVVRQADLVPFLVIKI